MTETKWRVFNRICTNTPESNDRNDQAIGYNSSYLGFIILKWAEDI